MLEKKLNNVKTRWEHIMSFENSIQENKRNERLVEFLGIYFSTKPDHIIYWLEEVIKEIQKGEI
ncbi:hypothetical protein [Metabacillus fastidiosus]|uniref:hypothetical protein n=1 Tax=Metabacillus fastidiosus TaxID=1458 RepID=UPI002DBE3DCE|nr:hypothetical protein [Metabacillus fastidiosus]MEC2077129.1 hypothetical protein [Metabacillus fastidiosus]